LVVTSEEKNYFSFVAKTRIFCFFCGKNKIFFSFLQQKNTPKKLQIKQRRGKKGTFFFL
jgi:hypothetical protein